MSKRARRLVLITLCLLALVLLCACGAADTTDTAADTAADTAEATDTTETADTTEATDTTEAADTTEADATDNTETDAEEAAADSYTVIFDSRGGTEVPSFTAPAGSPLHLGANPVKDGSTFVTWEDQWGMPIGHGEENTDLEWDTEPGQEITLYAVWE